MLRKFFFIVIVSVVLLESNSVDDKNETISQYLQNSNTFSKILDDLKSTRVFDSLNLTQLKASDITLESLKNSSAKIIDLLLREALGHSPIILDLFRKKLHSDRKRNDIFREIAALNITNDTNPVDLREKTEKLRPRINELIANYESLLRAADNLNITLITESIKPWFKTE